MTDSNYEEVLEAIQDKDYQTALENLDSEEDLRLYAEIEAIRDMASAGVEKMNDTEIRVTSNLEDRLIQQLARRVHGKRPLTVEHDNTREWLRDIAAIAENNLNGGVENPRVATCRMVKTAVRDNRPITLKSDQAELQRGEQF
jgi:hypothetical protein